MMEKYDLKKDEGKIVGFELIWESFPGLVPWLKEVNNQPLGKRFMATGLIFFILAGILALLMRVQLAIPMNDFIGPDLYNQIFTVHGTTMMFLFVVPFLEGLALYILPLMIGSRDVAFPRLSAFSYWCYLFGGILFFSSLFIGTAPDAGWFAYTPLSGPKYAGIGMDFWVLGLSLVEVSGIATGIELGVTILKFRAEGMRLNKMPLFVWTILVIAVMITFAFSVLLMTTVMLELDRLLGTSFFNEDKGGSSLLWQHLFWFFGHPDVYIMFLPAAGIVSTIVSTFARRQIVGYILVVMAIVVMGFVSFGLWVHHMFTTGLPELANAFFTAASLIIAVASGIQIFAWIATIWGRRPAYKTPFLFILGFFAIFVLGGLTGVMVAVAPFDWQVHDTYFIVAHFHYVLIGGVVFPIFAGISYWFPKVTGKMMSEAYGKWSFWLMFIGFNLTFFPMHIMGLVGMTRRVYTYPERLKIADINLLATVGAFIMALGTVVYFFDFLRSYKKGSAAEKNPWGAYSIEWSISSPPPIYAFLTPPYFNEKDGLFVEIEAPLTPLQNYLTAYPTAWRGTQITNPITGEAEGVQWLSSPTWIPFISAVALLVAFVGLLLKLYLLSLAAFLFLVGFIIQWLWPSLSGSFAAEADIIEAELGLTMRPHGNKSIAWWGMIGFIIVMSMVLGSQLFSYFYIWLYSTSWPQGNLEVPGMKVYLTSLLPMILSLAPLWWLKREIGNKKERFLFSCGLITFILALTFFSLLIYQIFHIPFTPTINAYASLVYVLHWVQGIISAIGVGLLLALLVRMETEKNILAPILLQAQITSMFWIFNAISAVLVGLTVYLSPLLI